MCKSTPEVVDLSLMFIDALLLVWMCHHQALGCIVEILHLLTNCCKVTLQSLVFTLQALHSSKIVTEIRRVQSNLLLLDPVFCLICIPNSCNKPGNYIKL